MLLTLVPIALSLAAFVFSVFTWRERKSKDQRGLFLRMHERLIDIDLQRGRRILTNEVNSLANARELFRDAPDKYDLANRSLAMLDVAALYVERGYIDKALFLDEWGSVYGRLFESAQYFIAERVERNPVYAHWPWPHFQALANQVRKSDEALGSTGPAD